MHNINVQLVILKHPRLLASSTDVYEHNGINKIYTYRWILSLSIILTRSTQVDKDAN